MSSLKEKAIAAHEQAQKEAEEKRRKYEEECEAIYAPAKERLLSELGKELVRVFGEDYPSLSKVSLCLARNMTGRYVTDWTLHFNLDEIQFFYYYNTGLWYRNKFGSDTNIKSLAALGEALLSEQSRIDAMMEEASVDVHA